MTLGVQIEKKAQLESGIKKEENIQRKIKEVRRFREEIHMAEGPALTIRLERDEVRAAREPAPPRQQGEKHTRNVSLGKGGTASSGEKTGTGT